MKTKRIASLVLTATMAQGTIANALINDVDNNKISNLESNKSLHNNAEVVNGIKINKMLIDINYSKGVIINPKYIVIHDTGNTNYGAGAINHRNYFANHPSVQRSSHYIVDDKNIVQSLEDNWRGWHIEDEEKRINSNKPEVNNSNSIGIEITVNKDSNFDVAMKNSVELTKSLMKKYNIKAENVITHQDVTGKTCPRRMVEDRPYLWENFKKLIQTENVNDSVQDSSQSGIYSEIKTVSATVNYAGRLDVYREKNVASNSVGVVYNKEKVKLNYADNEWANITFNSSQGGTRTGFIKIDNLNIDEVQKVNRNVKVSSQATAYKDLNNNYQDSLDKETDVKLNYIYKEWANISYNTNNEIKNGFINKQFIEDKQTNESEIDISNKNKTARIVNANSINIRQEKNTTSSILKVMYKNETVKINFNQGEWANVTFTNSLNQEKTGFMKSEYLEVASNLGQSPRSLLTGKGQVVNVSSNLRIRKGPATSYDVIGLMNPNDKFDILGKQDNWYKVCFNGVTGYAHKDYVKILNNSEYNETTTATTTTTNNNENVLSKGKVVNVVSQLNMREGAGTNKSIISRLNPNDVFDILQKENDWYKIKFNGKIGFVNKQYVQEIKDNSSHENTTNQNTNNNQSSAVKKYGEVVNAPSGLRVRNGAGTSYDVLTTVRNGQKVEINGKEGLWYKISINNKNGYVHSQYIKDSSSGTQDNSNKPNTDSNQNNSSDGIQQCEAKKGKVTNVSSTLRIRENSGTSYNTIGYINNGEEFEILGKKNGWYKIKYKEKIGYISGQYVQEIKGNDTNTNTSNTGNNNQSQETVINKRGRVINITSSLTVRTNPSTSGSVVGYLTQGSTFDIIAKNGSWYKIKFDTYDVKKVGYVHSDYVEEYHEVSNNNQLGRQVVDYAKRFLGIHYVWGGTTPNGFDCSGLIQYVFNHFGIRTGRTTWDQIKNGQRVDMSAIKEGDIIFFGSYNDPSNPTHVGMYIGNNQFIHAPKPGDVVKISTLSSYGMNKIQVNRLIN